MPVRITICVSPKAKNERWKVSEEGTIRYYTPAPPVDGKANEALIKAVAKALKILRSQITIVSGQTSRIKTLSIETDIEKNKIETILTNQT